MASPGELVQAIAETLGLPEATVVTHDRNLVMAGLRSKGGRGRNAASVTARDAAHLIVALLGSALIKDSVASVRRYARAVPDQSRSSKKLYDLLKIEELTALPAKHSFLDGLEALVASAAGGSLARLVQSNRRSLPLIEVAALTPGTAGVIRIAGMPNGLTARVLYTPPGPWRAPAKGQAHATLSDWQTELASRLDAGDLEQQRRISWRTIERVAEMIATKEHDDG